MLTILFIILKITGLIYVSWWWVLIPIIIDEEASRRTRERKVQEEKERKQASYSAMIKKYSNGFSEIDIIEILEEYNYDIDEEILREELVDRM